MIRRLPLDEDSVAVPAAGAAVAGAAGAAAGAAEEAAGAAPPLPASDGGGALAWPSLLLLAAEAIAAALLAEAPADPRGARGGERDVPDFRFAGGPALFFRLSAP